MSEWTYIPHRNDNGFEGYWTPVMLNTIREMRGDGYCVHHITDQVLQEHNGPARWQTVRDQMKEMWPGQNVKGDYAVCPGM